MTAPSGWFLLLPLTLPRLLAWRREKPMVRSMPARRAALLVANTKQTASDRRTCRPSLPAPNAAAADLGGVRSMLNVPMLKDGELTGATGIFRNEFRPLTSKQIELIVQPG